MENPEQKEFSRTVWLVEDDPVLLHVLESAIKTKFDRYGLKLVTITDGLQALLALETTSVPDLVLLDLMLPHESGFKVLEKMRSISGWKTVPVVVLSNLSQTEDVERAKALGVKEYLVKANTRIEDIVDLVGNYFN